MWNISRTQACMPLIYSGPSNDTIVDCKQALDHKKWWGIDCPRMPAHQNRKCKISPELRHTNLLSLWVPQMT